MWIAILGWTAVIVYALIALTAFWLGFTSGSDPEQARFGFGAKCLIGGLLWPLVVALYVGAAVWQRMWRI